MTTHTLNPQTQALADKLAILELMATYAYTYDGKDADGFAALFTEDAVFGNPARPLVSRELVSREAIRAFVQQQFAEQGGRRFRHYQTNTVFLELSAKRAATRTMLLVTRREPTDAAPSVLFSGVYEDEWRHTDSGWRIARRMILLDGVPPGEGGAVSSETT
jgi:uncharacterized protein (TIGR02246 family)